MAGIFLGMFIGAYLDQLNHAGTQSGVRVPNFLPELPQCGDQIAIDTLKSAVADSPTSKLISLKLLDAKDGKEIGWSSDQQKRTCRITAFTNAGEQSLIFSMKWIDRSTGKWFLQTETEGTSPETLLSATPTDWRVLSIEGRITTSDEYQSTYAWKLTIRNDASAPALFNGRIEFQDTDGFIVDTDRTQNLRVNANSDGIFTGYTLMATKDAAKVVRTVANISKAH
jgi:hypothetical protein